MLKLPKGLKKKKKGKKYKKDQELFTEEELEQYKREHQLQHQKPNEESDAAPSDSETKSKSEGKSDDDDEWLKFKALTAGVDSVVHKTQEDLDRIKSTSFFKRVPPPSEQKKLDEKEAAAREAEKLEQERLKKEEAEANRDKLAEAVVELSESETESEEDDDIFATDYIDVITSGEVQLTVVPDSPDLEVDEGPDPFDTSYADKLIKGPEVSKRGKKLVSLGSAVEVLTGRVEREQAVAASGARRKPRRGVQDLLLENFEDEALPGDGEAHSSPEPTRTLLDDPADEISDVPIDLSVSLHLTLQKEQKREESEAEEKKIDVVSEFDAIKEDEDDEFAELAVESLTKKEEVVVLTSPQPLEYTGEVESDWAAFEQTSEEDNKTQEDKSKAKAPPPRPPPPSAVVATKEEGVEKLEQQPESEEEFEIPDDDPFDTTFAEKVLPGTESVEDDDFDFDPRAEEKSPEKTLQTPLPERDLLGGSNPDLTEINTEGNLLSVAQKDLLGGSTTDLSSLAQAPIAPVAPGSEETVEDFDPFDTSAVSNLVQPKEVELKFLEKELLADSVTSKLKHSLSDPDFDPRAQEEEKLSLAAAETKLSDNLPSPVVAVIQPNFDSARRKSSLSLNLNQQKSVAFLVPSNDLLSIDQESGKIQKPLTPYYPQASIPEKEAEDPFDTSFVPETKPTTIELNILEQDLLTKSSLKHSLSDPDFDPRADDSFEIEVGVPDIVGKDSDLLSVDSQIDIKVLTPAQEAKKVEETGLLYADPFDTSIAANILPGQAELKLIEKELLPAKTPEIAAVLDTLTDAQELGLGDKVLTPQIPIVAQVPLEDIDPFDTSFADNLGPGKTEIKILETELIDK